MKRPYIICHMLSALDGKITGKFMATDSARPISEAYAKIRTDFQADAWLYGTVTTKEFTNYREPDYEGLSSEVPEGDFIVETGQELYYASVDTKGEIGWESGTFSKPGRPDAHVIEILTESTSRQYRAYLRKKGVSYILAGEDKLDCKLAVEKLYELFNIDTMLICGGGGINWTFLQGGVLDELSLLLAPAADGSPDSVTVFEKSPLLLESVPAEFMLKSVKQIGDGVWLNYVTKNF